jgi:hypothetical protein
VIGIVGAAAVSRFGRGWRGLGRALAAGDALAGMPDESPLGRARKLMSRGAALAAGCLHELIAELGWSGDGVAYYLGVGASGGSLDDLTAMLGASIAGGAFSVSRFGGDGLAACNPLLAFQLMNNFTMTHGAILEGTTGPNGALFSRGAGTTAALVEAIHAIDGGDCERAIAGGADSALHPVTRAELVRDGFVDRGLVPGEGAALVALARSEHPLAVIEGCAIGRTVEQATRSMELAGIKHVVIAAWGRPAADDLREWVRARAPDATVVDIGALGDSLAATQALGWVAALELLPALVLGAGTDGEVGAVLLGGPRSDTLTHHMRRSSSPRRRGVP